MPDRIAIEPFRVAIDDAVLADLADRIAGTRWPRPYPRSGWEYGVEPEYLRSLLASWASFDWRAKERELNRLSHHLAHVDGTRIHFIHERGSGPAPLPLILTHGWPSSFVEYLDLLPMLTDPAGHGARAEDSFDVVVASMPGYAFSDPLDDRLTEANVADIWARLMRDGLGYERFGAHGSDVGAGVTTVLGLRRPHLLAGIHLSAFYCWTPPQPWPPAIREFLETSAAERAESTAYSRMQCTKPLTAAYGLTDSPAGLAAWIVDVFRSFSDCGGDLDSRFTREQLVTNLMIYWATSAIGSSIRGYYDETHFSSAPPPGVRVEVPCGFAVFADDYRPNSARPPRELAEYSYNVQRWEVMPRGGHFAALEEPALLAHEIREFFRPLREGIA